MSAFVTAAELRTFLDVAGTTGRASTSNLDLLIGAASDFLERATGRIITASASNTTRTFTSHGRASITIPDLRAVGSNSGVMVQGSERTASSTYWLLPSPQSPDIYTGIQLHQYDRYDYRSNPDWFDRNLDKQRAPFSSLPNDVVITGLWGWAFVPNQWKLATLTLAGYEYKRPDSLLANVSITPEGGVLDYGQMPPEVKELIDGWRLPQDQAVSVG